MTNGASVILPNERDVGRKLIMANQRRRRTEVERSSAPENRPRPMNSGTSEQRIGDDVIRARAYELHRQRGGQPGHDWDDWFLAERELRQGSGSADNPTVILKAGQRSCRATVVSRGIRSPLVGLANRCAYCSDGSPEPRRGTDRRKPAHVRLSTCSRGVDRLTATVRQWLSG